MALKTLAEVNKIDDKLNKMYQNQATVNFAPAQEYVDRSELLLGQMNFIAMNNRSFLNLK